VLPRCGGGSRELGREQQRMGGRVPHPWELMALPLPHFVSNG